MSIKIKRATVLGAGVMGAQIAAHLAAAGVRVHLLDLHSDKMPDDPKLAKAVGKNFRSTRSIAAIEMMKTLKPSPLMSDKVLPNIIPGNFEDDMSVVADSDWIIEAVVERLDIKKQIHKKISEYIRPGVPVCTNTSGIPLSDIATDLPDSYLECFFGTHFFNPPRYMHLLEIIPHSRTSTQLMKNLELWISERLGKGIVFAFDTVNFIANRIGTFNLQITVQHQNTLGLNIETVDNLTGQLMGRPSSATFRTLDVVGLDTYAHVAKNVVDRAKNDPYRETFKLANWMEDLLAAKSIGQKVGKGCYFKGKTPDGKTDILVYRPETKEYATQSPTQFAWMAEASKEKDLIKRLKLIMSHDDAGAKLIWNTLRDTMIYSAMLVEEIAGGEPKRIDEAMRWGFNWEMGPFEIWQAIGYDAIVERMKKDGMKLPSWIKENVEFYRPAPCSPEWTKTGYTDHFNVETKKLQKVEKKPWELHLPKRETKDDPRVVASNKGASLLDIGDGIGLLVFHSKMNAIDNDLIEMMMKSVAITNQNFDGLVIGNDGPAFSAGANLMAILGLIDKQDWQSIDTMLRQFQGAMQLFKYAPFPTVSCPFGMTLGGGCEVSLHTTSRVIAGETYAGLVEMGVGLIPAGGGTKELALRAYNTAKLGERTDPMSFLQKAFMLIGMAKVSTSGLDAVEIGLYPKSDFVSLSKEHQILKAKGLAFQLSRMGYVPPVPETAIAVVGDPGIQTIKLGLYNMQQGLQISPYDALIGEKIATVLCGGEVDAGTLVSEQYFLDLERRVFLELCQQPKTRERIEFMLKNGKPLRN